MTAEWKVEMKELQLADLKVALRGILLVGLKVVETAVNLAD